MQQDITVVTTHGEYEFIGQHIAGLVSTWQSYQAADGTLYQFREDHIVCVISCDIDDDNAQ